MFSLWRIRAKSVLKLKLKIKGIYGSFKKLTLIHFYYAKRRHCSILFLKYALYSFPSYGPPYMMSSKGNGAKARGNRSLVVCVGGQVGNLVRIQLSTLTTPVSPIIHRHATAVDRHSTASERKERLYQGKLTWTRRDQYSLHLGDEGSQFPTISSRETLLPSPLRSFLLSRSVDTPETRNSECSEAGVDAIARCSRHHRTSTRHKRPIQRRTTNDPLSGDQATACFLPGHNAGLWQMQRDARRLGMHFNETRVAFSPAKRAKFI